MMKKISSFFKKICPSHEEDMGLGKILLLVMAANILLSFLVAFVKADTFLTLVPMTIGLIYLWLYRPMGKWITFTCTSVSFGFLLPLMYVIIGKIDSAATPTRFDSLMSSIDLMIFQMPVADWILKNLTYFNRPVWLWYDIMITFYFCYYILPLLGGFFLIKKLPSQKFHLISSYNSSIVIFFIINFFCYLIVPVSGPQYHLHFANPLPLGEWGAFLHQIVVKGQTTYIDCFPSGHFGIGLLVSFWLAKYTRWPFAVSFITTVGILGATLSLRYHYTMDLFFSFPLAWISYKAGILFCQNPLTISNKWPR